MKHLKVGELYKISPHPSTTHTDVLLFKSLFEATHLDLYIENFCVCLFLGIKNTNYYKVLYKNSIYYVYSKSVSIKHIKETNL